MGRNVEHEEGWGIINKSHEMWEAEEALSRVFRELEGAKS